MPVYYHTFRIFVTCDSFSETNISILSEIKENLPQKLLEISYFTNLRPRNYQTRKGLSSAKKRKYPQANYGGLIRLWRRAWGKIRKTIGYFIFWRVKHVILHLLPSKRGTNDALFAMRGLRRADKRLLIYQKEQAALHQKASILAQKNSFCKE